MTVKSKDSLCESDPSSGRVDDVPSDKGDNLPSVCSTILTYLDDACSRSRINYLGLTLKATPSGTELFDKLDKLALENDKERLVRILSDVEVCRIVSPAESRQVNDGDDH